MRSRAFALLLLQFLLISSIVALFFPLREYLQHLGAPSGSIGFILGADALSAMVAQLVITPFIHAGVARGWLKLGVLILALALAVEGGTADAGLFTAARLLQGVGFVCVVAALMPLFVLCIPREMSGRAFGWISLTRLVPFAVIPSLFDFLPIPAAALAGPIRSGVLLALAAGALLFWLPRFPEELAPVRPGANRASLREAVSAAGMRRLLAATALLYAGYANVFFFLNGFARDRGVAAAGMFFTLATLAMMAVRLAGGLVFDRYDKQRLAQAALVLSGLATGLLALATSDWAVWCVALLCGLGWGAAMPLLNALIFDISRPEARGLNQNLALIMLQGGYFLGPLAGGWALGAGGYPLLFGLTAATFALAAALVRRGPAP